MYYMFILANLFSLFVQCLVNNEIGHDENLFHLREEGNERTMYSVMQSDGNSLCGYVVLDSLNISYRNEDSI